MAGRKKQGIITFKVDEKLAEAMERMPNRSAFIRSAILAAMENVCPLCTGTGILSVDQRNHWDRFARDHSVRKCRDCDSVYLVCDSGNVKTADDSRDD